mmetsp:Transcript_3631/g.7969  ORF Transcript_3631/g.7969 Transcript_3631/m.7969 type:complete len:80 (+) Transcript_3631:510-749(+)
MLLLWLAAFCSRILFCAGECSCDDVRMHRHQTTHVDNSRLRAFHEFHETLQSQKKIREHGQTSQLTSIKMKLYLMKQGL